MNDAEHYEALRHHLCEQLEALVAFDLAERQGDRACSLLRIRDGIARATPEFLLRVAALTQGLCHGLAVHAATMGEA
jgi:hypothetical protein